MNNSTTPVGDRIAPLARAPSGARQRIALAFTGASGAPYGLRLLQCLVAADLQIDLMLSKPARVVFGLETPLRIPAGSAATADYFAHWAGAADGQIRSFGPEQWTAPVASGSGVAAHMVVCPCSTATLSAIAVGASRGLIERAADVALKERRGLVLVVRETPLSEIHLENMLRLARMGAVILPACPAFYHEPQGIDDLVDFVVARVLDHVGVDHQLTERWGAAPDPAAHD